MELDFSITYDSDVEAFDGLDMYYGAKSLMGTAEAISVATHGILNGNFISKTTAAKGFKADFRTSFEGSFKQRFKLTFTEARTLNKLIDIGPKSYLELLQFFFKQVSGEEGVIERRKSLKLFNEMYYEVDLSQRLATAIANMHAPVKYQGYKAKLSHANTEIITFNQNTLNYLEGETTSPQTEEIEISISRFNARTGTGRVIEELEGESFSFNPGIRLNRQTKRLIINSLRGIADGEFKPIIATVSRVTAMDGRTKRFILHGVRED